jgi:hypothetical protein
MSRSLIGSSRTISGTRTATIRPIPNGDFELAPPFTAATTTNQRWINGTAAGSTTDSQYCWAINGLQNSCSTQFDSSQSHSGTNSLRVSTLAVNAFIEIANVRLNTAAGFLQFRGPTVFASAKCFISWWMKTNFVSGDSNDGAYMQVFEFSTAASNLANHISSKVKTTTGWTNYTMSFTCNASCAYLEFQPRVHGNTGTATLIMDAWYDDITLSVGPRTAA